MLWLHAAACAELRCPVIVLKDSTILFAQRAHERRRELQTIRGLKSAATLVRPPGEDGEIVVVVVWAEAADDLWCV